jgi:hypothetical protein
VDLGFILFANFLKNELLVVCLMYTWRVATNEQNVFPSNITILIRKILHSQEYTNHLTYSRIHKVAMRRLAVQQKTQLSRMRTEQRNAQKNLEQKADDTSDLRPQFCLLCRLNYRQLKEEHQMSEAHKNMKKFLMPYCSTCKISYKSPMAYESHRCSLEHIRVSTDFAFDFFFLLFVIRC